MESFPELGDRLLVIYDGQCGFCNRTVRWFLRRDHHDRLRFAPSDSPKVMEIMGRYSAQVSRTQSHHHPRHTRPRPPHRSRSLVRSDAAAALLAALLQPLAGHRQGVPVDSPSATRSRLPHHRPLALSHLGPLRYLPHSNSAGASPFSIVFRPASSLSLCQAADPSPQKYPQVLNTFPVPHLTASPFKSC